MALSEAIPIDVADDRGGYRKLNPPYGGGVNRRSELDRGVFRAAAKRSPNSVPEQN